MQLSLSLTALLFDLQVLDRERSLVATAYGLAVERARASDRDLGAGSGTRSRVREGLAVSTTFGGVS